jgi:3-oxoacyl-ACP reductase-like protein
MGLMTTAPTLCSFFVFIVTFSAVTVSMAQAQAAIPIPKHTYAYMTGAKNGLAAAIVDQYNVGAACASFTGSDLDHCIPDYYSVVAGYQYDVFSFWSSAFNLSSFSG